MTDKCPKNPWVNINWSNAIAKEDLQYLQKEDLLLSAHPEKKDDDYIIHDDLLPEPFWGDLNSNVYILNGNPGYSEADDNIRETKALADPLLKATIDTLTGNNPSIYWLDQQQSSRPEEERGKHHSKSEKDKKKRDGYDWWNDATKPLCNAFAHKYGSCALPSFCNIEYFPYHSKKMRGIKLINNLPSNEYVDWWIGNAIEKDKIIIIVRCASNWLSRIDNIVKKNNIVSYNKNNIIFGASQNIVLSQNNLQHRITICDKEWENIIDKCKR